MHPWNVGRFCSVLANPQEGPTGVQKVSFGGGPVRETPSKEIQTKADSFLTVPEPFNSLPEVSLGNTEHHLTA